MVPSLAISRCIDSLGKLEHSVKDRNICELKNFLQNLDTTLSCIQVHLQRTEYKIFRTKVLLYLSHVQKLLPMFVSVVREMKPYNKKIVLYLNMGLKECLTKFEKVFEGSAVNEDKTGKFVCGVENALKMVSDHRDFALPEEWKSCLDDLLCQAFTIAKIALNNDLNEITAVSQKLLISSETHMDPEMQTKHGCACQLFKDTVTADLITLEHRVNTAVLRLVLRTCFEVLLQTLKKRDNTSKRVCDYKKTLGPRSVVASCGALASQPGQLISLPYNYESDELLDKEEDTQKKIYLNMTPLDYHHETLHKAYQRDPNRPLKKLLLACSKPEYDRSFIQSLYDELDDHVDCILHICDFAVACCDSSKSLQKIQCCVATLEFLDSLMIPEISVFAKDVKNEEVRISLKFLCKLWHSEVNNLERLLDGVIDSTCFCQVTYKEVSEMVIEIKKAALERSDFDIDKLEDAVKYCAKLNRHLSHTACLPNHGQLKEFSLVINECKAVMNLYVESKGDMVNHRSVAKRYELLAACVKRISTELADVNNTSVDIMLNKTTGNAFTSRLKFPDSVRNLPLDVSISNTSSDFSGTGFDWLKRKYLSHVQKVKYEKNTRKNCDETFASLKPDLFKTYMSRVSERKSFLYKRTPRKSDNHVSGEQKKCNFQMDNFLLSKSEAHLNCSLEITEILENLSSLPDTLTSLEVSSSSNTTVISNRGPGNGEKENSYKNTSVDSYSADEMSKNTSKNGPSVSKLGENGNVLSPVSVRTDEVSDITTPERLCDLDSVDSKIKHLKLTVYGETHKL